MTQAHRGGGNNKQDGGRDQGFRNYARPAPNSAGAGGGNGNMSKFSNPIALHAVAAPSTESDNDHRAKAMGLFCAGCDTRHPFRKHVLAKEDPQWELNIAKNKNNKNKLRNKDM